MGVRLSSLVRKTEFRRQDVVPRVGDVVGWAARRRERRTCCPPTTRVKIGPVDSPLLHSQPQNIAASWLVPVYTARCQKHTCSTCPRSLSQVQRFTTTGPHTRSHIADAINGKKELTSMRRRRSRRSIACSWWCGGDSRRTWSPQWWPHSSRRPTPSSSSPASRNVNVQRFPSTFPSIPQGPSGIQPQCTSASATVIHNQVRCRPSNKNTVRSTRILSQRPWRLEQSPHSHQTHWLTTCFPCSAH